MAFADDQLSFSDTGDHDGAKVYLYIDEAESGRSRGRVLGLVVAEPVARAHRAVQTTPSASTLTTPQPSQSQSQALSQSQPSQPSQASTDSLSYTQDMVAAECGISRIWVDQEHRRQHIATRLLDAVRTSFTNFGYPYEIGKDVLAFSIPTTAGALLAAAYCGRPDFLVYR